MVTQLKIYLLLQMLGIHTSIHRTEHVFLAFPRRFIKSSGSFSRCRKSGTFSADSGPLSRHADPLVNLHGCYYSVSFYYNSQLRFQTCALLNMVMRR